MFNMHALDTLIAVVVVILVLSLIVQSIQAAIKKFLRLKSRQIQDSLVDLFEQVLNKPPVPPPAVTGAVGPSVKSTADKVRTLYDGVTLLPGRSVKRTSTTDEVRTLYEETMKKFAALGRTVATGGKALESLTKEDLSKVIATVGIDSLFPGGSTKFEAACNAVSEVRTLLDEIQRIGLTGDAQLQWAKLRNALAPLLNDVALLVKDGKLNSNLVGNILNLRGMSLNSVLEIIGAVRTQVARDAEQAPMGSSRQGDLREIVSRIDALVKLLSVIPAKIDEAVAPIRARIAAIDTWYDTVMQSFDERYTRSMRTWSIVIGLVVAIVFNASIFRIYDRVSADDALRTAVVAKAQSIVDAVQPQIDENEAILNGKDEAKKAKTVDEAKKAKAVEEARKAKAVNELQAIRSDVIRQVSDASATYSAFGFRPIFQDGKAGVSAWTLLDPIGWLIMALLLSLGAPFWHDALASLFGVKSLLEKKTQTRNVEQLSGEGATQSA